MGAVPVFKCSVEGDVHKWVHPESAAAGGQAGVSVHVCVHPWSALTCSDMCPIRQPRGMARYADLSPARMQFI